MGKLNDGKLTVYGVPPSPPSNFVWMALDRVGIKYEKYEPNLLFKEHKSPWYLKINKNGALPAIRDEDGFCQNEGVVIVKYLIESRNIDTELYPYKDAAKTAKINESFEFISDDLRHNVLQFLGRTFMGPKFGGLKKPPKEVCDELCENLKQSYARFDKYLEVNGPYLNSEVPTIADIYGFVWLFMCNDLGLCLYEGNSNVEAYMEKLKKLPELDKYRLNYTKTVKMFLKVMKVMPIMFFCTCCFCCWGCGKCK